MKAIGKTLSMALGFAIMGGLLYGAYYVVAWAAGLLARMNPEAATATAFNASAVLLASLIVAGSVLRAAKRSAVSHVYAEKVAAYQVFVETWIDAFGLRRGAGVPNQAETAEKLQVLDRLVVLYGSPRVVKAQGALRELMAGKGAQSPEARAQFVRALMEIRTDLGSGAGGLGVDDVQLLLAVRDGVGGPAAPAVYTNAHSRGVTA